MASTKPGRFVDGFVAQISLSDTNGNMVLTVSNQVQLREDDSALRMEQPISPEGQTRNGEQSSGRGLARLRVLLVSAGGGNISRDRRMCL